MAVANHLQFQLEGDQYGSSKPKDLLKHGVDGITAYIDLSNGELMRWIKTVPAQSSVYRNLLTIRDHAPISDTKQLLKKKTKLSDKDTTAGKGDNLDNLVKYAELDLSWRGEVKK